MPRKPRIHYPGARYHVICRGNNREWIYRSESEKKEYGIAPQELYGKSRTRNASAARKALVLMAMEHTSITGREIAKELIVLHCTPILGSASKTQPLKMPIKPFQGAVLCFSSLKQVH